MSKSSIFQKITNKLGKSKLIIALFTYSSELNFYHKAPFQNSAETSTFDTRSTPAVLLWLLLHGEMICWRNALLTSHTGRVAAAQIGVDHAGKTSQAECIDLTCECRRWLWNGSGEYLEICGPRDLSLWKIYAKHLLAAELL